MNTYDELYSTLLRLCKKEGLKLVETELKNKKIMVWFHDEYIIINSYYKNRSVKNIIDIFL